jgi:hypothetical protein
MVNFWGSVIASPTSCAIWVSPRAERVFSLLARIPELDITALGTLRNGSVFCPLFSAFGPEPVRTWMAIGEAKVLVTTTALYRRKIPDWRGELSSLKHVVLINDDGAPTSTNTADFAAAMARASAEPRLAATGPEDLALLHFTSGTHSDDVFWCTAYPGWVTGTSYDITTDRHFWSLPGGRGRATHEGIRQHAHIGRGSLVAPRPTFPADSQIAAALRRGNCQAPSALRSIHGPVRSDRRSASSALPHEHFSDHHARSRRYTSGGREQGIFRTAGNLNVHASGHARAAIAHKLIEIKVCVDSQGQFRETVKCHSQVLGPELQPRVE